MTKRPENLKKMILGAREDMDSMFEIFSHLHRPFVIPSDNRWYPDVDVFETDTEVITIMDIAHIDPREIEVTFKNNTLVISGLRQEITDFKKRHYHKMEIDYGPFERKIDIPVPIDEEKIKTKYQDGFLQIRLTKREDRRGKERKINIDWIE